MNWLSQMIRTPIDLSKMYPAERPTLATGRIKNFEHSNAARSSRIRNRYLDAIGDKTLTANEIRNNLGSEVADAHTVRKMLYRLLKDEMVVRIETPNGKNVLWEVAK